MRDIVNGVRGWKRGKEEIENIEQSLKEFFSIQHVYLVSSGKAALCLILESLKKLHPDRDTILIPAYICYSVPSAIKRAGLKVTLCDIDIKTLDYDFEMLESIAGKKHGCISDRILGIVSPHLFGLQSDVKRIKSFVSEDVFLIEDAAQSLGNYFLSNELNLQGDITFFSLGRGKAISSVEGGIILCKNSEYAAVIEDEVNQLKCYSFFEQMILFFYSIAIIILLNPNLFWVPKAMPFLKLGHTDYNVNFKVKKISAFQVGLLKQWKYKLKKMVLKRQINIGRLNKLFFSAPISKQVILYTKPFGSPWPLLRFPVFLKSFRDKERILALSEKNGLGIMPTYPDIIANIPELSNEFEKKCLYESSENAVKKIITFPVHQYVSEKDIIKFDALLQGL